MPESLLRGADLDLLKEYQEKAEGNVRYLSLIHIQMCIRDSIFIGWVWKSKNAVREITNEGKAEFKLAGVWSVLVKFVLPVLIAAVFVTSLQKEIRREWLGNTGGNSNF